MSRKTLPRQLERPVVSKLRELCLSLPETSERASWGHPNFRAGKRTFVTFEVFKDKPSIAFRLDPVNVDLLLRRMAEEWQSHSPRGAVEVEAVCETAA